MVYWKRNSSYSYTAKYYTEAKRIVDSRTPTIGVTHAAVTFKPKRKIYQSTGIRTKYLSSSNSESPTDSTPLYLNNKNLNKPLSKPKEKSISQKPSTPKLPMYEKAKEFSSNKKTTIKNK